MALELRPKMSFVTAFVGMFVSPYETLNLLLYKGEPVKGAHFLLWLIIVVLAPPVALYLRDSRLMYRVDVLACLFLLVFLSLFFFIFLENILLRITKIKIPVKVLMHISCYCLSTVSLVIIGIYLINYWSGSGDLANLSFIPQGAARIDPTLIRYTSTIVNSGGLIMILQFTLAVRSYTGTIWTTSFFTALLALGPLSVSVVLSLLLAEKLHPGFIDLMNSVYRAPILVMN